jgi:hypothetical protein
MNWKLVLLVATAASLTQAQGSCPTASVPSHSANTNFIFDSFQNGWAWVSGTVPNNRISDNGFVTWKDNNAGGNWDQAVTVICIEYNSGTYSCIANWNGDCYLDNYLGIANAWGFS